MINGFFNDDEKERNNGSLSFLFFFVNANITLVSTTIMCYFCHVLGKNPQAPDHYGSNCLDKANSFSKIPMNQRLYENGNPIANSDSDKNSCVVCMNHRSNITFIPCGHVATCELCSSQVQICPICRQKINERQKIFFL